MVGLQAWARDAKGKGGCPVVSGAFQGSLSSVGHTYKTHRAMQDIVVDKKTRLHTCMSNRIASFTHS